MSWIKRNLVFVILSGVAVILLGLAGFYLYSQMGINNKNSTELEASYGEMTRIANLQPNPGNEKVNNIAIARENRGKVRAVINQAAIFFKPIPATPPGANVSAEDFTGALRKTIDELTRNAASASVTLQPKYEFSFAAQKPLTKFARGSLEPLAAELGDVKAICDVLFKAKINMLYNLRRPRVSDDDLRGPQSDYLDTTATTNELAVMVPYEVVFYGFSGELAAVLSGFAADPHGFMVVTLNVEPGAPGSITPMETPVAQPTMSDPYARMRPQPVVAAPVMSAGRGGLPVVLDEKQLKITMGIIAIKLRPKN